MLRVVYLRVTPDFNFDHREKASTNSTRDITSRAEALMDGCFWMEMRLFLRLKLTCKFFLLRAENLNESQDSINVFKQFTCLQIWGRKNTKEDVRGRSGSHPSSDSYQVGRKQSGTVWHRLTFSFVKVKHVLCFLDFLFSFCHIQSANRIFLKASNISLKKKKKSSKRKAFNVSPELPWLPFSSWGEISPPVGTSLLLTWLHISKLVSNFLWWQKTGNGYCY